MKKTFSITIWLISGIVGFLIFVLFFNHAFPIASIDLKLSKEEIFKKAKAFVLEQGFDLKDFEQTIIFDSDDYASIYLQKTQGIKKSNELIAGGIPVWFWGVRWFKELKKEGFTVDVDPTNGKIINFNYYVLDDEKGLDLTPEQARIMAEEKVARQGLNLKDYELKDSTIKKQKNRTDYFFVWEKKGYFISEATLRLSVDIYGDKLGYFGRYLKVPEEFIRDLKKETSFGQVLSMVSFIFMILLIIAAIVVIIIQFKKDNVNWKFGLGFGIIIAVLTILSFFNAMPLLWASYPDTVSKAIFLAMSFSGVFIGALLTGLIIFLFGSSGESLARDLWATKFTLWKALKNKDIHLSKLMTPVSVGYSLGFIFLGYVTLFYLLGAKFFNIWMPPEVEYSNILGTAMPFLFPLTIAVTASISEEFMFRLFSISFLKKYLKLTWLGILLPALIWAYGHSNYPVFPAYVRGIELTLAGIVFGVVFLKYGLESVIIAHFVIDAALVGLPLLKSGNIYFRSSGIIVMTLALIPVFIVLFLLGRKK